MQIPGVDFLLAAGARSRQIIEHPGDEANFPLVDLGFIAGLDMVRAIAIMKVISDAAHQSEVNVEIIAGVAALGLIESLAILRKTINTDIKNGDL